MRKVTTKHDYNNMTTNFEEMKHVINFLTFNR